MAARSQKAAGRKLAANVWVGDPVQFFAAGSTPPKEYADQITNPNAWADAEDSGDAESDD